jgi:hypothetical protein
MGRGGAATESFSPPTTNTTTAAAMPFFLPALGALCSDFAIVYLMYSSSTNDSHVVPEQDQTDDEHGKYAFLSLQ